MWPVLYDLHGAARHLWKAPMLALTVLAILATGIGLNVAASNLIDSTHEPEIRASIFRASE
jgi:hypothetical protein